MENGEVGLEVKLESDTVVKREVDWRWAVSK